MLVDSGAENGVMTLKKNQLERLTSNSRNEGYHFVPIENEYYHVVVCDSKVGNSLLTLLTAVNRMG